MRMFRKMATRKRPLRHYLRSLYAWHRWLGIVSAVFVLLLASTGLALNHTDGWKLGEHSAPRWLHARYGIVVPPPQQGFALDGHWFTAYEGWLYYDASPVTQAAMLVGVAGLPDSYFAATERGLVSIGAEQHPHAGPGQLIEVLNYAGIVGAPVAFGQYGSQYYLETTAGFFSTSPGSELRQWSRQAGAQWPETRPAQDPPSDLAQALRRDAEQRALSWERVLLDLHSGRLFGAHGELLMDAAALLFVILALSGMTLWLRFNWRQRRRRRALEH